MEEKINLVELLKDCPEGMELDCLMYDNVSFVRVEDNDKYPIVIKTKSGFITKLTKYGHNILTDDGKCVIFPKGENSWQGFQRPFKDGDILSYQFKGFNNRTIFIYRKHSRMNTSYYVALSGDYDSEFMINNTEGQALNGYNKTVRFATEEEKQKLFQAIKDNGYKWNSETKTLEKIKFENGDIVVTNLGSIAIISNKLNNEFYETHCLLCRCHMIRNVCTCVERLATEEEKQKLFQAIKDNDYKWNSETKTLEKLFKPKFKDGDIITDSLGTCIFKGEGEGDFEGYVNFYCGISYGRFSVKDEKHNPNGHYGLIVNYRLSTEEEKAKFFQAIKDNGYKWNSETKTLEKLFEPKFKVGDMIRGKYTNTIFTISSITPTEYKLTNGQSFTFHSENCYELVTDKFDFSTLIPFESKVLVRNLNTDNWLPDVYVGRNKFDNFVVLYKERPIYKQCIPYEGNEHLLGTTSNCDKFYKV